MYIVAIAWLYVTVLMAATETSFVAGALTFFFYGLAPMTLFLWLFGTPTRRRASIAAARAKLPQQPLDVVVRSEDGTHPKQD